MIQGRLTRGFSAAVLLLFAAGSLGQDATPAADVDNERIVREFISAWSRLDADELVTWFTEDGTYFNMPTRPVTGRENLRVFIAGFLSTWDETDWEIVNLLVDGNIVVAERVDRTVVAGRRVDLPCVGVFELEHGKIKVWRDYFDLATFTNAVADPR